MTDETKYICIRCGYNTKYKNTLLSHINKKKLCPCEKQNISREKLLEYYDNLCIKTDLKYKCEYCPQSFKSVGGLKSHQLKCENRIKELDDKKNKKILTDKELIIKLHNKVNYLEKRLHDMESIFLNYKYDIFTQNVKLCNYGFEKTNYIDKNAYIYFLINKDIIGIIKDIHFSKDNLQNCNIRLHKNDIQYEFIEYYYQGAWIAKDKTAVQDNIIIKCIRLLTTFEGQNKQFVSNQCVKEFVKHSDIIKWLDKLSNEKISRQIYYKDISSLLLTRNAILTGNMEEDVVINAYDMI